MAHFNQPRASSAAKVRSGFALGAAPEKKTRDASAMTKTFNQPLGGNEMPRASSAAKVRSGFASVAAPQKTKRGTHLR